MKKKQTIDTLIKEGKVRKAKDVPVPERNIEQKGDFDESFVPVWVKEVEDFCNLEGITVKELIAGYKLSKKKFKGNNEEKGGNAVIIQDFTKENAVGKPYNPFKNPLFTSKIKKGSKE